MYQTPCFSSLIKKKHIKMEIETHLWLQESKICIENLKIPLTPYFRPLRPQMGPYFRFCVLFLISNKKQSYIYIYITTGIKLVYLENWKFLPPFYSIAKFHEIGYHVKTSGRRKIAASFQLHDKKLHLFKRNY